MENCALWVIDQSFGSLFDLVEEDGQVNQENTYNSLMILWRFVLVVGEYIWLDQSFGGLLDLAETYYAG